MMHHSGTATRRILRPPQVRGANRAVVLQLLRHHERLSRAEIARQSGLSEGTVSRIVAELVDERLVSEDGIENSTGGRPGKRLHLEPKRVAFGADIQNREIRCSAATMRGRLVETRRFPTPARLPEALDRIAAEFLAFRKRFGSDHVEGLGISVRGIVNSETGVLQLGSRPDWVKVPIKQILEQRLKVPVFVQNNVRAAALAEYNYGAAEVHGSRCFLFIKIDEGVGTGILLDGKPYLGTHMAAGEFGQMVIATTGGPERHDRPGCLERLVCNSAICELYLGLSGTKRQASLGDASARIRKIAQLALAGDPAARKTVEETSRYLGVGISNIIWGLDADVVIIDGVICDAWQLVEPMLRAQFPNNRDLPNFRHLVIRKSALAGDAALIGATTLPFTSLFTTGERPQVSHTVSVS